MPLIVKDLRGVLAKFPDTPRTQLTSSVDVAPLLLTLATGSEDWRRESYYAHLAGRTELVSMLADPTAPGRPYVFHASDEIVTEYAIELYAANAPLHIAALRTPDAKYAIYSNWAFTGTEPLPHGQQRELYDYSTQAGRLKLQNTTGNSTLEELLNATLESTFTNELRAPLPQRLIAARNEGFRDYLHSAKRAAAYATRDRKPLPRNPPHAAPTVTIVGSSATRKRAV